MSGDRGQRMAPGAVIPPPATAPPPPPPPSSGRRRTERLNALIRRHRAAVVAAERAEERYAAVVARHRKPGRDSVTADFMAADDPDLQQAVSDRKYEDDKAVRYGLAALVDLLTGGEPC